MQYSKLQNDKLYCTGVTSTYIRMHWIWQDIHLFKLDIQSFIFLKFQNCVYVLKDVCFAARFNSKWGDVSIFCFGNFYSVRKISFGARVEISCTFSRTSGATVKRRNVAWLAGVAAWELFLLIGRLVHETPLKKILIYQRE